MDPPQWSFRSSAAFSRIRRDALLRLATSQMFDTALSELEPQFTSTEFRPNSNSRGSGLLQYRSLVEAVERDGAICGDEGQRGQPSRDTERQPGSPSATNLSEHGL
jgi:hypothetical protein